MSTTLQDLQRQLREQFPEAHQSRPAPASLPTSSGLPAFPAGALSELSPAGPATGLSLVLAELLESECGPASSRLNPEHGTLNTDPPLALIDGRDSFDPASYGSASCSRLLWIRCHHAKESLRCTDLLLRDGNLPLLVLDLQLTPLPELRQIPTSSWYRLRNLAKQSGSTLLVFTPRHLIPCATLQLVFPSSFSLADLESTREELSLLRYQDHQPTAINAL